MAIGSINGFNKDYVRLYASCVDRPVPVDIK